MKYSEFTMTTVIGDEINISVMFDYQNHENTAYDDPGCDSEVTINAVLVAGRDDQDIKAILSDKVIDNLVIECFEFVELDNFDSL